MERKHLDAGKKVAEELAPNPVEHTPEAPIISEEEAQSIESPSGSSPQPQIDEQGPDDIRRQAGTSGTPGSDGGGGIRITPKNE